MNVTIKGKQVDGGCGYSLEIPCPNTFEGDSFSFISLKNKFNEEEFLPEE